jgi:hypothetical protein
VNAVIDSSKAKHSLERRLSNLRETPSKTSEMKVFSSFAISTAIIRNFNSGMLNILRVKNRASTQASRNMTCLTTTQVSCNTHRKR